MTLPKTTWPASTPFLTLAVFHQFMLVFVENRFVSRLAVLIPRALPAAEAVSAHVYSAQVSGSAIVPGDIG